MNTCNLYSNNDTELIYHVHLSVGKHYFNFYNHWWILPVFEYYINGVISCRISCVRILSLNILKRFNYILTCISNSFLICCQGVFHCINMPKFISPFFWKWPLSILQHSVTMNKDNINILVQWFIFVYFNLSLVNRIGINES